LVVPLVLMAHLQMLLTLQDLLLPLKGLQQILNLVAHLERMISLQIQVQLSSMKEEIC